MVQLLVVVALMMTACSARAGIEMVELGGVQVTHDLAGIVTDPSGSPVPDVTVAEVDSSWRNPSRRTTTDAKGHFVLSAGVKTRLFYLVLTPPTGFNPMRLRVKLVKKSKKELTLQLELST